MSDQKSHTGQVKTDTIGNFGGHAIADNHCRGCAKLLLLENAWMTDGCPCNSGLGCNDLNQTRWRLLMQLQQRQARELESIRAIAAPVSGLGVKPPIAVTTASAADPDIRAELPKYLRTGGFLVHALQIGNFEDRATGTRIVPRDNRYAPIGITTQWVNQHRPCIGGWYVVPSRPGGSIYYVSSDTFEKEFVPCPGEASTFKPGRIELHDDDDFEEDDDDTDIEYTNDDEDTPGNNLSGCSFSGCSSLFTTVAVIMIFVFLILTHGEPDIISAIVDFIKRH